jgi:signal transduction histidine kinase
MLAFANIILEEAKEGQKEWILHVETIRGELVRLLGMVEDLLDVERLGAAGMPLRRAHFDLTELVREQVAAVESTSRRRDLMVDAPPDPLTVDADRERIAQVLSNLISNAIKYSPEGGAVQIEVASREGAVLVSVSDTGIGIPEDQQDRIFTKFFRAESSDMAGIPGLGLGLALSRDIVSLHGGTMGFTSAPGRGSTFWFELPTD